MRTLSAAVLAAALTVGGCTVGQPAPDPVVRDGAMTIDLTRPPTRSELGFPDGGNQRAYQHGIGQPPLTVTLELPTGTLRVPAFLVAADGNDHTPAGESQPRQPERIVVERTFASAGEAADSLTADAALLGLNRPDLELLLTRVDQGTQPAAFPQQGSLSGFVRGWLSAEVDVIGQDDPSVQVNYVFTVGAYHNSAVDKVVHDGVFGIDLTRRPTRADLAFRDGFSLALVRPAPDERLAVRVALPGGVLNREVASVSSSTTAAGVDDASGTGEPRHTAITLPPMSVADAERALRTDALTLGLDPHAVDAVFGARSGFVTRTLTGDTTSVYEVSAHVEVTLDQPGAHAASIRYDFGYRG